MARVHLRQSKLSGKVEAPPSKSYTHRALFLATLADGRTEVERPLAAEDTFATVSACTMLGASVSLEEGRWMVKAPGQLLVPEDVIDVKNSGTTLRVATAISSLTSKGFSVITGDASIRRRPMQPLLDALNELGVRCWAARENGCPPVIVQGGGMAGGETALSGGVSSQFVSALLIAALRAQRETKVKVRDRVVSRPYIDATVETIELFGGNVKRNGYSEFLVPRNQMLTACRFRVPGDFSSAALMAASAVLSEGEVTIRGLDYTLPQPDLKIVEILRALGCKVQADRLNGTLTVEATGRLTGGFFDLFDSPDLLPVVAVLALKAREPIEIVGVEHTRYKESDRISILAHELSKLGLSVEERSDGLRLQLKGELRSAFLDAHQDHRLFMAFCAAAQAVPGGCVVEGLETASVSYPRFLDDVRSLGGQFEVLAG